MQSWLGSRAKAGDVVIFYYAGQTGSNVRTDPETHESTVDYFLMPTDADPGDIARTGWSLDRALDLYPGKFRVACWLGTTARGLVSGEGKDKKPSVAPSGRDWLTRLVRWPGASAWLASDRVSSAGDENPAVLFTTALIEGLGQANSKRNLAACLRSLNENPALKQRGFQTMGGVPPELSVWSDQFVQPLAPPPPEVLLQVGHANKITGIVSSSDSRMIISASMDSTLRAWAVEPKSLVRILTGHWVGVTAHGSQQGRALVD